MAALKRYYRRFELGGKYMIKFTGHEEHKVILIRSSAKGYNFLDVKTYKCLFKIAMSMSSVQEHTDEGGVWLYIPVNVEIKPRKVDR